MKKTASEVNTEANRSAFARLDKMDAGLTWIAYTLVAEIGSFDHLDPKRKQEEQDRIVYQLCKLLHIPDSHIAELASLDGVLFTGRMLATFRGAASETTYKQEAIAICDRIGATVRSFDYTLLPVTPWTPWEHEDVTT